MKLFMSACLNVHLILCDIHVKTELSHGIHDIYNYFNEIRDI